MLLAVSALPLPDPDLSSGGVLLRPWLADEAVALHAAFADPEVLAFTWPSPDPYLVEDAQRFLEDQQRSRIAGQELQLAVAACGTGMLWGGVSLYAVDLTQRRASIGYWLTTAARGRGAATTAVRLLTGWGFDALNLARVELTCGPDNIASQRVAQRRGFRREGVLRSHMTFKSGRRDTVVHSLLAGDLAE